MLAGWVVGPSHPSPPLTYLSPRAVSVPTFVATNRCHAGRGGGLLYALAVQVTFPPDELRTRVGQQSLPLQRRRRRGGDPGKAT